MPQGYAIKAPRTLAEMIEEAKRGRPLPAPNAPTIQPEMSTVARIGQTLAQWLGLDDPVSAVMAMAAPMTPNKPITAYHGSPHDFDKFSLTKIGTGEGAQSYGHGLYFAENPGVASDYQRRLSGYNSTARYMVDGVEAQDDLSRYVASSVYERGRPDTVKFFQQTAKEEAANGGRLTPDHEVGWFKRAAELAQTMDKRKITRAQGRMYEVGLHASPDDFLDWDKPLSQQSEKVRKAIKELAPEGYDRFDNPALTAAIEGKHPRGVAYDPPVQEVLNDLASARGLHVNSPEVTELLRSKGFKGVRYLDQGSRMGWNKGTNVTSTVKRVPSTNPQSTGGPWVARFELISDGTSLDAKRFPTKAEAEAWIEQTKRGTSNYVVFDDSIIDIKKKLALLMGLGAGAEATRQQLPQRKQQ